MNTDSIRWYSFQRDALPEALFGEAQVLDLGRQTLSPYEFENGLVAVGYSENRRTSKYTPPSLIVLGDKTSAEIFSWLKVYATETSPLSQFARVLALSDWEMFSPQMSRYEIVVQREDRWASVIVGEALAQAEGEVDLADMPLSRASGCFSTAVARAAIIHGSDTATRACTERLRQLEIDRRFVRRSVHINDLIPVWAITGSPIDEHVSVNEAVSLVMNAAKSYMANSSARGGAFMPRQLNDYPGLSSDSVEERVMAFRIIAADLMQSAPTGPRGNLAGVTLASAAFLVGRSTSHAFLLRRLARMLPTAYVWFGLLAALAGPRSWDPTWSRAAKSIERPVRARFDWTEPPVTDLCWAEFAWLANTFEGIDAFSTLPKNQPRVLSVEVVPGATCQLRLATSGVPENETRTLDEVSVRENELKSALVQFVNLATRAKSLLEGQVPPKQQSLGFESNSTNQKAARGRRTKRSDGDQQP